MSEFDKEAERRRLREKYEADQEDRETTERMSQLLLQGATMTNHHCDDCGSPIFRYQGQEFCPTCQAEAEAGASDAEQAGQASGQSAGGQSAGGQPTGAQAGGGNAGEKTAGQAANQQTGPGAGQQRNARADTHDTAAQQSGESQPPAPRQDITPEVQGADAIPVDDLGDVGQALASTIATLAARAEQTDDPRRAKEFLEAAHEAAETLRTLHG